MAIGCARHLRKNHIAFDKHFLCRGTKTITKTRVIVRNQQFCRLDYEDAPAAYRNRVLAREEPWSASRPRSPRSTE